MRNYIAHYRAVGMVLLLSLLVFSGCSGKEEEAEPISTTEIVPTEETVPTIELPTPEILPEESAADTVESVEFAIEPVITEVDLEEYFDGINGAAVIYNPSENSYQVYNRETALTQRSPCSTFKIISSLIGLENEVIAPEDSTRTWSGETFWNENWNRDINFEDAFRTSCVWYYREVINEIGPDVMQEELDRLCYGNCDISDWEGRLNNNNNNRALTGFWIESSLKISPKEQVEVMERIFGESSIYLQETQDKLKQVMLVSEQQNSDTLIYGKTGLGKSHGVTVDAWFTGFADTVDGRKYFCVYLGETEGKDVSSTKAKEIAIKIVS